MKTCWFHYLCYCWLLARTLGSHRMTLQRELPSFPRSRNALSRLSWSQLKFLFINFWWARNSCEIPHQKPELPLINQKRTLNFMLPMASCAIKRWKIHLQPASDDHEMRISCRDEKKKVEQVEGKHWTRASCSLLGCRAKKLLLFRGMISRPLVRVMSSECPKGTRDFCQTPHAADSRSLGSISVCAGLHEKCSW